jgi:predicted metal-dependent hydrolase
MMFSRGSSNLYFGIWNFSCVFGIWNLKDIIAFMPLQYTTVRSRRRTVALEVTLNGDVIVRLPHRAREEHVREFIAKKQRWIERTLRKVQHQKELHRPKTFTEGEEFHFLGQSCRLRYMDGGPRSLNLENGEFLLSRSRAGQAERFFVKWYRNEARRYLRDRVQYYAGKTGLAYGNITITGAKKRWGSCNRHNDLSFSWRLVLAPLEVIDYVVVHELVHSVEKNHSRNKVWKKVAEILPAYKEQRKWLKEHGAGLFI